MVVNGSQDGIGLRLWKEPRDTNHILDLLTPTRVVSKAAQVGQNYSPRTRRYQERNGILTVYLLRYPDLDLTRLGWYFIVHGFTSEFTTGCVILKQICWITHQPVGVLKIRYPLIPILDSKHGLYSAILKFISRYQSADTFMITITVLSRGILIWLVIRVLTRRIHFSESNRVLT